MQPQTRGGSEKASQYFPPQHFRHSTSSPPSRRRVILLSSFLVSLLSFSQSLRLLPALSMLTDSLEHSHDHSEQNLGMGKKPPLTHDHSNQDLKGKPHTHDHSEHDLKGKPHSHDHSEHDLKGAPKGSCGVCNKSTAGKPHKPGDRDKFCPPHENGMKLNPRNCVLLVFSFFLLFLLLLLPPFFSFFPSPFLSSLPTTEYCCAHCDLELSGPVKDDGKGKRYVK
jgi:hypothetical protein